jgi:hypothetical protein
LNYSRWICRKEENVEKVTGKAQDRLDVFRLDVFLQNSPKNRHPERSASRIYGEQMLRSAESKDPSDAYVVDAVLTF